MDAESVTALLLLLLFNLEPFNFRCTLQIVRTKNIKSSEGIYLAF